MRNFLGIAIVSLPIFISSCGVYQQHNKMVLYQQITATNDTLDKMTKEWHQLLSKATATKNFSYLAPTRVRLAQFLNRNRPRVANLEVNEHSEAIRDSEVIFLGNQATIVSEVYSIFDSDNDLTPDDVIMGQLKTLGNDLENETNTSETIRQSLRTYAKKSGINSVD